MTADERDPALDRALDHVSRRSFLERMGVSTVAAAILGPEAMAQDRKGIALSDKNLVHEDVTFTSGQSRVEAFLCRPKGEKKRGAVIVVHQIFGLNDHIRDIACRLAQAGFIGLSVNYFTREGKPPDASGDFTPLMDFVGKIPDAQIMADTVAAADYLRGRSDSNDKVGLVGFSWGGRVAMLAAAEMPHLDAVVAYYGRILSNSPTDNQPKSPMDLVAQMHAPLLGNFGGLDKGIPPSDADALRVELKKHDKTAEIYVYEGANHAFNDDTRGSYNADAAKLAWRRTLAWFDKYLKA